MRKYSITAHARADIFEIWSYIAADKVDAAYRVRDAILDACQHVADNPNSGHVRLGFARRNLRFWTLTRFPNYILVYRPGSEPLEVIAVLHGKRRLRRVLKDRP